MEILAVRGSEHRHFSWSQSNVVMMICAGPAAKKRKVTNPWVELLERGLESPEWAAVLAVMLERHAHAMPASVLQVHPPVPLSACSGCLYLIDSLLSSPSLPLGELFCLHTPILVPSGFAIVVALAKVPVGLFLADPEILKFAYLSSPEWSSHFMSMTVGPLRRIGQIELQRCWRQKLGRMPRADAGVPTPAGSRAITGLLSMLGQLAKSWMLRSSGGSEAVWRSVAESTAKVVEVGGSHSRLYIK